MAVGDPPCKACGVPYSAKVPVCPVCKVPRKGDVNWRAVKAYSFFLAVMFVAGAIALYWILQGSSR